MTQLSIRQKLFASSILGVAGCIAAGYSGYWGIGQLDKAVEESTLMAKAMRNHLEGDMMHDALRGDVLAALLAKSAGEEKEARDGFAEHSERFQTVLKGNQELNLPPVIKASIDAVGPELTAYTKTAGEIIALAGKNKRDAERAMPKFTEAFGKLEDRMEQVSDLIETESARAAVATAGTASQARSATLWVCALTALLALLSAGAVNRRVAAAFDGILGGLLPLSNGDLREQIRIDGNDEAAALAKAYNSSVEQLRALISRLQGAAEKISGSSATLSQIQHSMVRNAEIAVSSASTATGASEQVANHANVVTSNADQMVSAIREISSSAQEAARVAQAADDAARGATATITRLRSSMPEINGILGLITSVAEQTNLLALNAAIEAARAGQAGRGFTVVAAEVKQLAQQTAAAADDIAGKIAAIQSDAEAAAASVDNITAVIDKVNSISSTIAAAVEEQTAGTNEISRTIAEVSTGTNGINKNLTELARATSATREEIDETANCTAELGELVTELRELTGRFRL